jgi:hypothetical protein
MNGGDCTEEEDCKLCKEESFCDSIHFGFRTLSETVGFGEKSNVEKILRVTGRDRNHG